MEAAVAGFAAFEMLPVEYVWVVGEGGVEQGRTLFRCPASQEVLFQLEKE